MPILVSEILFTNILSQNCSKCHNEQNTASCGNMKLFSYYFGQIESFKYYRISGETIKKYIENQKKRY